jgi:hypothetical protein
MADPIPTDDAPASDADTVPDYAFDGYELAFSLKVGLTPPSKPATGATPGSTATP